MKIDTFEVFKYIATLPILHLLGKKFATSNELQAAVALRNQEAG